VHWKICKFQKSQMPYSIKPIANRQSTSFSWLFCYIYVFGLRRTLWGISGFSTEEEICIIYTRRLLLLLIQGNVCWTCSEKLLHWSPHALSNFVQLRYRKITLKLILTFWRMLGFIEMDEAIIRLTAISKFVLPILLYLFKWMVVYMY